MASKLLSRAKHSKALRDSGLFGACPSVTVSLLIAVYKSIYILYCRESNTYVFILLKQLGYEILSFLKEENKLDLEKLVSIAEMLLQEEIRMPEAKKVVKAKPAPKPKVVKTKPAAKPKTKVAPKLASTAPEAKAPVKAKVRKARGPNKKSKGSLVAYENLLKHEAELEKARKAAKLELKSEFDGFLKQADEIKVKYQKLFNENIGSAPKGKAKSTGAKKNGWKTFTLDQVQTLLTKPIMGKRSRFQERMLLA